MYQTLFVSHFMLCIFSIILQPSRHIDSMPSLFIKGIFEVSSHPFQIRLLFVGSIFYPTSNDGTKSTEAPVKVIWLPFPCNFSFIIGQFCPLYTDWMEKKSPQEVSPYIRHKDTECKPGHFEWTWKSNWKLKTNWFHIIMFHQTDSLLIRQWMWGAILHIFSR